MVCMCVNIFMILHQEIIEKSPNLLVNLCVKTFMLVLSTWKYFCDGMHGLHVHEYFHKEIPGFLSAFVLNVCQDF